AVEPTARGEVLQYRGRILPLVRLAGVIGLDQPPSIDTAASPLHVVVCSDEGRDVGLVVDRILDTVEEEVKLQHGGPRQEIAGSAVIARRVTDLLDVRRILHDAFPLTPNPSPQRGEGSKREDR